MKQEISQLNYNPTKERTEAENKNECVFTNQI